jgi:hypothetical protein
MEHAAHHSGEPWILLVAHSSARLAVFAVTSSLLAGHHANEAVLAQIKASNDKAPRQRLVWLSRL